MWARIKPFLPALVILLMSLGAVSALANGAWWR